VTDSDGSSEKYIYRNQLKKLCIAGVTKAVIACWSRERFKKARRCFKHFSSRCITSSTESKKGCTKTKEKLDVKESRNDKHLCKQGKSFLADVALARVLTM